MEEREKKPRRIHGPRRTGKQPQTCRRRAGQGKQHRLSRRFLIQRSPPTRSRSPGQGKGGTVTPVASPNQIQNHSSPLPLLSSPCFDSALQLTASALRCPSLTHSLLSLPHPLPLPAVPPYINPRHPPRRCHATSLPRPLCLPHPAPSLQIDSALASAEQQRQGGSSIQQ